MSATPRNVEYSANFSTTIENAGRAFLPLISSPTDDFRQIEELLDLSPDWDSYGAAQISEDAAAQAKVLTSRVAFSAGKRAMEAHPYYIGPTPTGGVQLEWRGDGREIRIEVRPDKTLKAMLIRWEDGRKVRTYQDNISEYDVAPLIVELIAGN